MKDETYVEKFQLAPMIKSFFRVSDQTAAKHIKKGWPVPSYSQTEAQK